jgi:hypothetical protein
MSAAMINAGLVREGRFSIRNKTTHGKEGAAIVE